MKRVLFFIIALSWTFSVAAQRVQFEGVSVHFGGQGGLATLPSYADFINATRAPELFRGAHRDGAVADGTTTLSTLT